MEILSRQPSTKGPAEMFTGDVWFDVAPDHLMTHLAMWEAPAEGPESEWGARVSDTEYLAPAG